MEEASVAGESPDRSKQRESSAEPTSGSADSVPEARDPRLAVAAEKETTGGVDTATRVFSVRDLKPNPAEENDTKLREAVAAWVRTGNPTEDAETSEDPEATPEHPADAQEKATTPPEDRAERPEDAAEGQEPPQTPKTTQKANTKPKATPEPPSETDTAPEDAKPAVKPKADAEPEDAKPADKAKANAEPEDAKPADKAKANAEPEDAKPADKAKANAEPEDAKPADDPKADAEPEDAKPADKAKANAEPEDAKPADKAKANAEPEDAKPADKAKANAEPEDAKPADKAKANAEPEDAKPADKAKANAEPEDAKPADEPIADAEPEDAKPADKPKADAEPEDAKPADKPKADAEPEDAKPADEPKGDVRDAVPGDEPADADGEDDPQGPPAPDNDGRTGGAGGNTKTATHDEPEDAEPADKAKADAEPADADGEDDPQGPPAPDNDGRTGGAGGDTETTTDGEATPQGSAVDQPTTMLKAPRPPQVDQPTTTLKLGGKPSPKSSERTSKFVALKSDIQSEAKPDAKPAAKPETASTTRTTVIPQVGPERTTRQPLPPKPPLDLLAELTNTPPPPETSVRTAIRRVKIWTPLVIVLLIVFAVVQTLRPLPQPTLDLTAKDTYTFDGSKTDIPWPAGGQAALDVQGIGTFGSSGDQKPVPIASVAKVMTAYIILRDHPLKSGAAGPKIKIDQAAQDQANAGQESTVDVTAGDSITQREALESILIASANNVARLLARWDAGSEKSFVVKMNATAKKLGMTNTTYTDPSGLTNSTVSTAVDQVKLAKAAMASEPAFREVAAMMSYDDYKGVNHGNWNQLVGQNNVVGIKTGTTTSALGNLVFAAKKDVNGETRTIIGAVIRQQANASNGNSILKAALNAGDQLIRAAQGALKSATIYKKGDVVGYADDGLGGRTPVVATQDVTAIGWSGLKVKLSFAADKVPHTAKAGTKVGTLTVGDGSGSAVRIPVALQKDLAEPGFTSKLTRLG
ncbi:D-alanyl-D-alanine carboxypeptidase [Streptomyces sp. Ag109_O5-1]|uniref:D-alanyl-D-alanine carboxypeptidase n=1 Tax=Streptomyces sp. Ag109_O5-1 TaxID=1938851 RepID=UPI0021A8E83B|nr:D-alanyl-D-alanine carboxypeptidase [Streptomyces sp. Ag109_O5-1]